jgi:hypothetical protein
MSFFLSGIRRLDSTQVLRDWNLWSARVSFANRVTAADDEGVVSITKLSGYDNKSFNGC